MGNLLGHVGFFAAERPHAEEAAHPTGPVIITAQELIKAM